MLKMEWMKKLARRGVGSNEVVCAGAVFERAHSWLFLPDYSWKNKEIKYTWDCSELDFARKQAPFLKKAILDESLPVHSDLISSRGKFYGGGRGGMIVLLGEISYYESLPQILEALEHDLHENIRHYSAGAIGNMGLGAKKYGLKLSERLSKEKSCFVREEIAESLGRIGNSNPIILARIRDALEESRNMTSATFQLGYFYENKDESKRNLCWQNAGIFEKLLISLYSLDKKQGREEFSKSYSYARNRGCPLLSHHLKNAIFWTGIDRLVLENEEREDINFIDLPFVVKRNYKSEEIEF